MRESCHGQRLSRFEQNRSLLIGQDALVRVMTWNLQGRVGDWEARHVAIESVLSDTRPDVVMLQESWVEPDGTSQAQKLADRLDLHAVTAAELAGFARYPQATYWVVNAVLTRWPSHIVSAVPLVDERRAPTWRHVLIVHVDRPDAEGGAFIAAGTHLEHGLERSLTRSAQMEHLLVEVSNALGPSETWREQLPALVAGDFNAVPWSEELRRATGAAETFVAGFGLVDAWDACGNTDRGDTWSSKNPLVPRRAISPNRRLDYITTTFPRRRNFGSFRSCELVALEPIDNVQPSDHYAVVAEVEL
jgi:endonuclease/exonuclease/phosphatase family metal-dependent hydrolase